MHHPRQRRQTLRPHGAAFTSVSLVPPLVLVSIGKESESYPHFTASKIFAVNFLRHSQQDLSQHFAVSGGDKFAQLHWTKAATGAPILEGVLGYVDCRIAARATPATTPFISAGRVTAAHDDAPLVYYAAKYARVAE